MASGALLTLGGPESPLEKLELSLGELEPVEGNVRMQKEWRIKEDTFLFDHKPKSSEETQHLWRVMSVCKVQEMKMPKRLKTLADATCPSFEHHKA